MYKVAFYRDAAKYYSKLDADKQNRIDTAINTLLKNPFEGDHIKKLKGRLEGKYRYAIGGLRIIYIVDMKNEVVYIDAIGPRGDVYK
jgi:mRNA interferase RelE/StbE